MAPRTRPIQQPTLTNANGSYTEKRTVPIDSLVVWRVVGGHIYEAWDIPAVDRGAAARG